MTQAINIREIVEQINALLKEGEPDNISEDTYNHYTGYAPQAIFDAMNQVLGARFSRLRTKLSTGAGDSSENACGSST